MKEGDIWALHIHWNETIMSQDVPYLNGWIFGKGRGVISFNIKHLHCIWKSIRFGRRRLPLKNHWHSSDARLICRRGRVGGVLRRSMVRYFVSHSACKLLSCEVPLYGMFWFGMVLYGIVWSASSYPALVPQAAISTQLHSKSSQWALGSKLWGGGPAPNPPSVVWKLWQCQFHMDFSYANYYNASNNTDSTRLSEALLVWLGWYLPVAKY